MRHQHRQRARVALYALVIGIGVTASSIAVAESHTPTKAATIQEVVAHYASMVHANYEDAHAQAVRLQAALQVFVANASASTLEAAKNAWKRARLPYGQSEVYRFYAGPIDAADGPESHINGWPLDESYIDYVEGNPQAGIIQRPDMPVTKERLRALNEEGGETNISSGYHALEFLLWGQDLSADGPGARPYTDYVPRPNTTGTPQQRRGQYLLTVAELLVDDLRSLVQAWAPDRPDNYRATFVQGNPQEALRKIITGMGTLCRGELAGQRMSVALVTRDQEDEHSCFSDNTHIDIIQNALGIENVYLGRYVRSNGVILAGPGIQDLVSVDLRSKMAQQLATTRVRVHAIEPPFDREIRTPDGRKHVQEAIEALRTQADLLVAIAKDLGIANLQVELPN